MVPGDGIGPNVCPFGLVGWPGRLKPRLIRSRVHLGFSGGVVGAFAGRAGGGGGGTNPASSDRFFDISCPVILAFIWTSSGVPLAELLLAAAVGEAERSLA
jgi:hypothetical protein